MLTGCPPFLCLPMLENAVLWLGQIQKSFQPKYDTTSNFLSIFGGGVKKKVRIKKPKQCSVLVKIQKSFQPKCDTTSNFLNCWRWWQKFSNKIAKAVLWLGKIQNSYQPKCDTTSIFFNCWKCCQKKVKCQRQKGCFFT